MGIVMKVNMICGVDSGWICVGCQPLVGYNYGARNKKRLKEILAFCYKFECGLAVILAVILSAGARPLIRVFMKTPGDCRFGCADVTSTASRNDVYGSRSGYDLCIPVGGKSNGSILVISQPSGCDLWNCDRYCFAYDRISWCVGRTGCF